ARIEHEWRARMVRSGEHELAGLDARLKSLQELHARRAEYGDAPRTLLAQANGQVGQRGAVADYLEVEAGYERAVEACLGDLLQHVIVELAEHAAAGFDLAREQQAGRCGFLIAGDADADGASLPTNSEGSSDTAPEGLIALRSVLRVNGPYSEVIRRATGEAWIAHSYDRASEATALTMLPIATMAGDVFRGPPLFSGAHAPHARGILETIREIK